MTGPIIPRMRITACLPFKRVVPVLCPVPAIRREANATALRLALAIDIRVTTVETRWCGVIRALRAAGACGVTASG